MSETVVQPNNVKVSYGEKVIRERAMGKLTAKARKGLPKKDFAGPNGSYPDEDASHARNALARVSEFGSPEVKAEVRQKVAAKYPSMGIERLRKQGKISDLQHAKLAK